MASTLGGKNLVLESIWSRNCGDVWPVTRRNLTKWFATGALVALAQGVSETADVDARRRKRAKAEHNIRGKKAILCYEGVTVHKPKAQRKKWLKRGATRGACNADPTCIPSCPAGACLVDDGCGGVCPGCGARFVCAEAVCQACTVSCTGAPQACGDDLRAALAQGGNIYLCPGNYQGAFTLSANVAVYGSGSGADAASNSILMMPAITGSGVIRVQEPYTATFSNLRVTGGNETGNFQGGGGVFMASAGANVTIAGCVITGNRSEYYGGGVYASQGSMTITGSEISGNTSSSSGAGISTDATLSIVDTIISGNATSASSYGGGIYIDGGTTDVTGATLITENTAQYGGGIYGANGTMNLSASVTVTENTATYGIGGGGGIYTWGSTINPNGATVVDNDPDQCVNVVC